MKWHERVKVNITQNKKLAVGPEETYCRKCGAACVCHVDRTSIRTIYFFECDLCGRYEVRRIRSSLGWYIILDFQYKKIWKLRKNVKKYFWKRRMLKK